MYVIAGYQETTLATKTSVNYSYDLNKFKYISNNITLGTSNALIYLFLPLLQHTVWSDNHLQPFLSILNHSRRVFYNYS